MGYRVDERVVLFIPPDFPDKKNGVQNDPANDKGEQYDPEKEKDACSPVK